MGRKQRVLALMEKAYAAQRDFMDGLSDQQRSRSGTQEDWSPKDALAHIAAWSSRLAKNIALTRDGKTPTRNEDFDHENAEIFAAYEHCTWEEVAAMLAQGHEDVVKQVEMLGEYGLESSEALPWLEGRPVWRNIVGNSFAHPLIHLSEFYQKLGQDQKAGELLGEMATGYLGLDDDPQWQATGHYNLACSYALLGRKEQAIHELRIALELFPDFREWSLEDPDLRSLREEPEYQALYG